MKQIRKNKLWLKKIRGSEDQRIKMIRLPLIFSILLSSHLFLAINIENKGDMYVYRDPIDAVSIHADEIIEGMEVSALIDGTWTEWNAFETENEQDPNLRESNLVIFPESTDRIRIRGSIASYRVHPLRTSDDPISYEVAARTSITAPRIISRAQWKADDTHLYGRGIDGQIDFGEAQGTSARERECERIKRAHPEEFEVARTEKKDGRGRTYRWPKRYSEKINLVAIHHTASKNTGDKRSGVERMRLLYQFHANSRGWGDVAYHYVIDDKGKIYEGRHGGKYVVGGHAFCSNVGTLGIALMGNFDQENPSQVQMHSLQWLITQLSDDYDISLSGKVDFHGKRLSTIVGHKDLTQTSCPGKAVRDSLHQIRRNVRMRQVNKDITFAKVERGRSWYTKFTPYSITARGSTDLSGKPGEEIRINVVVQAGDSNLQLRQRVAIVERSDTTIGLWQEMGGREVRVREELLLPQMVRAKESATIQMRIKLPKNAGIYTVKIGDVPYVITVKGRTLRSNAAKRLTRTTTSSTSSEKSDDATDTNLGKITFHSAAPKRSSLVRRPSRITPKKLTQAWEPDRHTIRIRLSYDQPRANLKVGRGTDVNGAASNNLRLNVFKDGNECVATEFGRELARGIVRITSGNNETEIESWQTSTNRFRGVIECQIVDGQMALINELPLESYMAGLAEEPDSEPYEKQRAFAIAARSYAAHYMSPNNRKFPGKPYDGSDSPKSFQKYGGIRFEEVNPRWTESVQSTKNIVVKKNGHIVKTPYFSRDNGRTKSPEEAGWGSRFPFAEVFSSKPDPWCKGMVEWGHGVGMSGCGAKGQALEGKTAEEILEYYYPTTKLDRM